MRVFWADPGGGGQQGGATGSSAGQARTSDVTPPRHDRAVVARAINFTFQLILAATGVPQPCPGVRVPSGCSVRLRATNGGAGNAGVVKAGTSPMELRNGGGTALMPLDDVAYPVDSTGAIWAQGTAGDGIVVSIVSVIQQNG